MSKKRIAIPGWSTGDNSWGVTKPYLEYFSQFGQVEILTPREDTIECDLVVLPGGMDTASSRYGKVPGFMNSNPDLFKEYFFDKNLPQYVENGTPIFGVCLGFQQLNVFFGGKLIQNIWWDHGTSDYRTQLAHQVYKITGFNEDTKNWEYDNVSEKHKDAIKVNSLHHQGVELAGLAPDLKPLLISADDFLVEAFEHKTLPISGVQYHPEEIFCKHSNKMIKKLLNVGLHV